MSLIASGMAGGLCACLLLRFVWASVAQHAQPQLWRGSNAVNEVLYVGAHALIGGGIGLLFWLSWGFAALGGLSWWQQGVSFGALNALVFGLLPLLILRGLMQCAGIVYWLLASELIITCVAAALAVSWHWKHVF